MVDDETLFKTMQVASETGALVMVHAENGDAIDVLVKQALAEGKTEPKWHAATRPPDYRGRGDEPGDPARADRRRPALRRPRLLRRGDRADRARAHNDWHAWGETCTQYLFIDETALDQPDFEGAKYVYTPPPRPKKNQELLGTRSPPTSSRSSPPTTARSTGTARRRSARTTSPRSPTADRGSRTACTCSTTSACGKAASR